MTGSAELMSHDVAPLPFFDNDLVALIPLSLSQLLPGKRKVLAGARPAHF